MRSEEFLLLYRQLEEALENKYARSLRTTGSVVMEYLRDDDSLPFRDRLNLCREIRNILTHNAAGDDSAVVEPSEAIVGALREIVEELKKPLRALTFATGAEGVMRARMDFAAIRLMRDMQQRGFSHIPVYDGGAFRGVFSVSTVFSYLAAHPGSAIDENTRLSDFRAFLPIEKHMTERFLFMPPAATYMDVKRAFEADIKKRKRVAVIFITDTGDESGALLGLITPWDALSKVQGLSTLIEDI
ncbi:MAG: CBS domain-containing protein [Christensenellaceae bacterium]|nr:CBS domain-containing protein [Christensenellaceae bacterium]MEA5069206.1 CBS domain-containing protein [Christensenellaceae bacterium]